MIDWVDTTTYLSVIMQSNLKFDQPMALEKDKHSKTLRAIKRILKQAPQEGRLLANTSLCRTILEYADTVWDPTIAKEIESLEMLQHRVVRFIARLRGLCKNAHKCWKENEISCYWLSSLTCVTVARRVTRITNTSGTSSSYLYTFSLSTAYSTITFHYIC